MLIRVAKKLKFAPILKLLEFKTASTIMEITEIKSGDAIKRILAYTPSAIAANAIGAANPMVIEINPERNPMEG